MRWAPLALLLGACSGSGTLVVPRPEGAKTAILAIEQSAGVHLFALGGDDPWSMNSPIAIDGAQITVLGYASTLDQLQLVTGPIAIDGPGADRVLPTFERGLFGEGVSLGADIAWTELTALSPGLRGVRLPALSAALCVSDGGCFSRETPEICVIPCAEPSPIIAPAPPAPVVPPMPPVFSPCPSGWSELRTSTSALARCEPPDLPDPIACAADEAQQIGATSCTPIGAGCPAGDFAPPPIAPLVHYVRPGAVGGDGTEALPFGRVEDTFARAVAGSVVMLSKGTYPGTLALPAGSTLVGACARETIFRGGTGLRFPDGGAVSLTSLSIRGVQLGLQAREMTVVELDGVLIEDTPQALSAVDGATIRGKHVVVRRAGAQAGIAAHRGALIELDDAVVEDSVRAAFEVDEGARARLRNLVIRRVTPNPQGLARGIVAIRGGGVELGPALIEDLSDVAIEVYAAGTATISDLVVRRIERGRGFGSGVNAVGAFFRLERALIEDVEHCAVDAYGGSTARVLDVVARRVGPGPYTWGVGLCVTNSDVEARRMQIESTPRGGVWIAREAGRSEPARVVLEDVSIHDRGTAGVRVADGAALTMRRAFVEAGGSAIVARDVDLALTDVRSSGPACADDSCIQVRLGDGARATLERVALGDSRGHALVLEGTAEVLARDLSITDALIGIEHTASSLVIERGSFLRMGDALDIRTLGTTTLSDLVIVGRSHEAPETVDGTAIQFAGGAVSLSRLHVRHIGVGINTITAGSMEDARIEDVNVGALLGLSALDQRPSEPHRATLARVAIDGAREKAIHLRGSYQVTAEHVILSRSTEGLYVAGDPLVPLVEASVIMERFRIDQCSDAGVWLEPENDRIMAPIELSDGLIEDNGIGIQTFERKLLTPMLQGVRVRNNDVDIN